MLLPKHQPVDSTKNLRERVDRLLRQPGKNLNKKSQIPLDLSITLDQENRFDCPSSNIAEFLDFITDAMPDGDVYLFGGILRDLALFGKKGFNSDIDLVVEGNWSHFVSYLDSLNAHKNKFGGYRLTIARWPVDIWSAKETWAIKHGFIQYKGISSLTETTVLNWDAILMNWRTKNFICRENYFEEIYTRSLNVVLEQNPNPLGMAVRVFRHLYLKDAEKISKSAATYLANCTKKYSFEEIKMSEISSYRNSVIELKLYKFFQYLDVSESQYLWYQFNMVSDIVTNELGLDKFISKH